MPPLFTNAPRRLCLLRLSAIGDCTHMLPIVHTLQRHWPQTQLTWIVGRTEAALVGDLPGVEFITFDKQTWLRAYRDLYHRLTGRRFDALLLMQVALRANLASLAIRAPIRLGYDAQRAKDGHGLFINHRIAAAHHPHVIDGFFGFLEALGLQARELNWSLPLPMSALHYAERQLPGNQPTLVISACASHAARDWQAERYAAVADHAARHLGMRVVLTGGSSRREREMAAAILRASRAPIPILNLVGQTTLKELLAVFKRASVLICPDSGPAHVGTCAGIPVIGLYAASNPERTGPYLSRRWCINKYEIAAQRYLGKPSTAVPWGTRIRGSEVMELIEIAEVCTMLDMVMQERASSPLTAS